MKQGILIAFGELFLKSRGVSDLFKKILLNNLCASLDRKDFKVFPFRERIFIETDKTKKIMKIVSNVFGISWFSQAFYTKDIKEILSYNYSSIVKAKETFALRVKVEKGAIKQSKEKVIDIIAKKIKGKVDLSSPQKEIFIEIRKNGCFLYPKKKKGKGGLPVFSSGKVLTLMSGGIDSPVTAYLLAKRGAENIWLHFHSFPLVSNKSIEKIKEIATVFLKYQPKIKVIFTPFSKIQVEIKAKALPEYRILLYRRMMLRIAEIIARKQGCYAISTGESLGQVSSQTLPNINIIESSIKTPVLRPLIGFDKEEIIKIAKNIRTYDISIKPQEDCCTLFTPKHSTAKGDINKVILFEKSLDIDNMVEQALKEQKIELFTIDKTI